MADIQIVALRDPVAVVHIPIALAGSYESKLYWTLIQAPGFSEEFFNVTSNTLEIAIFASTELINREWDIDRETDVRISASWRVFEISSGDQGDEVNYDSPHLRHVSAPLARAGITILYQSSYFTDFILVKESDFERASRIFAEHNWHVDPTPTPLVAHKRLSFPPVYPAVSAPNTPNSSGFRPSPPPPSLPQISVLSAPLACVGFPKTLCTKTQVTLDRFVAWPDRSRASHRPIDEFMGTSSSMACKRGKPRPFISFTRTPEGSSLVTEVSLIRALFLNEEGVQAGSELLGDLDGADNYEGEDDGSESDEEAEDFDDEADGYIFHPPSRSYSTAALGRHVYTPPPEDFIMSQSYSLPPTPGSEGEEVRISWSSRTRAGIKTARSSGGGYRRDASAVKKARWSYDHPYRVSPISPAADELVDGGDGEEEEGEGRRRGRKACLQLDCRSLEMPQEGDSYHLDSCGLLTRFSTLLESDGIKMLYSSTFHTANILVEARDVRRAKKLLEKRRGFGW